MNEVYDFLKNVKTYFLATVEGDQPRVRPFGTIDIFDGSLTIQTGKVKDVSKQIHQNPKIEICAFDGKTWLRLKANAYEDERIKAQEHMLETHPNLKNRYQVNDGNTEVFKLTDVSATFYSFTSEPRTIEF